MENLFEALPEAELLDLTIKQAKRSTLRNFKTGAVIFNYKTGEVLGKGCSHQVGSDIYSSNHAEYAALCDSYGERNHRYNYSRHNAVLVVCLGRALNIAMCSRPCLKCTKHLQVASIELVYYPERLNNGEYVMNIETPRELLGRAETSNIRVRRFAKAMRIPSQHESII